MGAGAMGQPAAGGKGQPGGQQQGSLPSYAQSYYQQVMGGQPQMGGQQGYPQAQMGGQPPAAGGKGQVGGGGQSPAPGGKGQPGSPGMNPQMAGPIINNPSMGGSQQPQMPITQLMQQYNQAQAMGGQQPSMSGQPTGNFTEAQYPVLLPQGMGGQQGNLPGFATPPGMVRIGDPAPPPLTAAQEAAMGIFRIEEPPSPYMRRGFGGQPPVMGGQQPQVMPQVSLPQGMGGQQPPQPPQMSVQDFNRQRQNLMTQRLQASSQGRDTAAIQNQLNDLNRNYAAQRGPQPNNPLARPQQLRPEDPRMMAMRNLQQLQRG